MKFEINVEKKHLGYFFLFLVLVGSLVVLATVPNPGHPLDDIEGWDNICTGTNVFDSEHDCYDDVGEGGGEESFWTSYGANAIYYDLGRVAIGRTPITGSYDLYVEERAIFNDVVEARDSVRIFNFPEDLPTCDSSRRGMIIIQEYHSNPDSETYGDRLCYCKNVYYQSSEEHSFGWYCPTNN